jgi:HTH-type transcriptional repressor of NAD biosynthesis genes
MAGMVGLLLGKYTPFHAGHVFTVEKALDVCETVVVLMYDSPSTSPIPLSVRAGWVRSIFGWESPFAGRVVVLEGWDGPQVSGYTPAIKRMHEEYIVRTLAAAGFVPGMGAAYTPIEIPDSGAMAPVDTCHKLLPEGVEGRAITHFFSSEPYGEHVSQALGAIDARVDMDRHIVPISGTACREDPYKCRKLLPPVVYNDLICKVVFVGAPSTGKSTITERMAAEYCTQFMPEYGREYWELNNVDRRLSSKQLVELAEGHREREEKLIPECREYLFVDTNAITTYMFGMAYHGAVENRLAEMATLAEKRYDVVFLCGDDIPYADTWDRSGDMDRKRFQKQIRADLITRRIPFITLTGTLDIRVAKVKEVLSRYKKWSSLGDVAFPST